MFMQSECRTTQHQLRPGQIQDSGAACSLPGRESTAYDHKDKQLQRLSKARWQVGKANASQDTALQDRLWPSALERADWTSAAQLHAPSHSHGHVCKISFYIICTVYIYIYLYIYISIHIYIYTYHALLKLHILDLFGPSHAMKDKFDLPSFPGMSKSLCCKSPQTSPFLAAAWSTHRNMQQVPRASCTPWVLSHRVMLRAAMAIWCHLTSLSICLSALRFLSGCPFFVPGASRCSLALAISRKIARMLR